MSQAVIDTILERRSIRSYTDEPVSNEDLDIILQCASSAPSARNLQPWHVVVVRNREWLDNFNKEAVAFASSHVPNFGPDRTILYNAPVVIFVCGHSDNFYAPTDSGMLTQNILLSAKALGLGTCVIGMIREGFSGANRAKFRSELSIPEGYHPYFGIALGHPAHTPDATPRDAAKITFLN